MITVDGKEFENLEELCGYLMFKMEQMQQKIEQLERFIESKGGRYEVRL